MLVPTCLTKPFCQCSLLLARRTPIAEHSNMSAAVGTCREHSLFPPRYTPIAEHNSTSAARDTCRTLLAPTGLCMLPSAQIFVADVSKRYSIEQICQHSWFLKNLPSDLAVSQQPAMQPRACVSRCCVESACTSVRCEAGWSIFPACALILQYDCSLAGSHAHRHVFKTHCRSRVRGLGNP